MKKFNKSPLAVAMGSVVLSGFAVNASAELNPFAVTELSSGYMQVAVDLNNKVSESVCGSNNGAGAPHKKTEAKKAEGSCGESKCGAMMSGGKMNKGMEHACGAMMKGKEGACGMMGAAKSAEGMSHGSSDKAAHASCGSMMKGGEASCGAKVDEHKASGH